MWFNLCCERYPVSWALIPAGVARWLLGLLVVCLLAVPAHAQQYDAAADFSTTDNPTGVWSYGWSQTLGAAFQLYLTEEKTSDGLDAWYNPQIDSISVVHNGTDQEIIHLGHIYVQPGQLGFHPGPNGQYSIVRWTAPADGIIAVQAAFEGLDDDGTTTDVHVLANGVSLFDGEVTGFGEGSGPSFRTIVYVSAGDTIDFAVGDGVDGNYYYDSTGIAAVITYLFGR